MGIGPRWVREVMYAVAFGLACLLGRLVHSGADTVSVVWPAVGVAVMWFDSGRLQLRAALARAGWVLPAATIVPAAVGVPIATSVALAGTTLVGGLTGWWVMRQLWAGEARLQALADGVRLSASAAATGVVSAATLLAVAAVQRDQFLVSQVWLVLTRNSLGALLVAAVVLAWRSREREVDLRKWLRALTLECALTAGVYLVGMGPADELSAQYLALPVTLIVALRADVLRAALHASLVAGLTVYLIVKPPGLFHHGGLQERFVVGQGFVAVVALTALGLALAGAERLAATRAAEATTTRLRSSIDKSKIAQLTVALGRSDGLVIGRANPAAHQLLDAPAGALAGTTWSEFVDTSHHPLLDRELEKLRSGQLEEWEGELLLRLPSGGLRWVVATVANMDHEDDVGREWLTVQLLDISARKDMEQHLAHQALHDDLTGLANRELLQRCIDRSLRHARSAAQNVALLFFDLDNFKHVNDSLGHAAGDEVISTVAARLQAVARADDTVARIGGDEFVVCCTGVSEAEALAVANRLLAAISVPIRLREHEVTMTASIGVAVADPDSTPDQLMRHADAAMCAAKDGGRARVERFASSLAARASRHLELDHALRVALKEEQFVLHYQPVVDITGSSVVGLEALVRWEHPERGLLLPGEWLDVAEGTDLMVDLGAWILREACRQMTMLPESSVSIYVNVSGRQLSRAGLVQTVVGALDESGLLPGRLVLELTETHLIKVGKSLLDDLQALRALGVRIAVDDFGTGFSSLQQLINLPVDALKIDRTFVASMRDDRRAATVVHAIIGMATALGLGLVGEGVETDAQAAALAAAGCPLGQGYLWSRPQPAAHLVPWLSKEPGAEGAPVLVRT